ncbi:hypothetical protein E2C01_054972 [Portunus trituberculatus]|uniref:Uncharacterized protein n=1 Tax=Portunus trituberculatus TaxID=210409 RepID=A0A5B7GQ03_PORTR|nr:hypothetical protein [Portunus trituberculatus]
MTTILTASPPSRSAALMRSRGPCVSPIYFRVLVTSEDFHIIPAVQRRFSELASASRLRNL